MSVNKQSDQTQISRRAMLKAVACAPLMLTFGFVASPLARFLKPTMHPGGFFQTPDLPTAGNKVYFSVYDFPNDWVCIPFMFDLKYVVFNPQQEEIRRVPGFIVRVAPNEIVAFSRICPRHGPSCILNFVDTSRGYNCGCSKTNTKRCCACAPDFKNPVLVCPCDHSAFDLADGGRVIAGRAPRPPRQFYLSRQETFISIDGLEQGNIG
jgi:Rieske Fe-S protein